MLKSAVSTETQSKRWRLHKRLRNAEIFYDVSNPSRRKGIFYLGPRFVKHYRTKEFVDYAYVSAPKFASERKCRVFVQNAHVAVEVYDYNFKLFNPDYKEEVAEGSFILKRKDGQKWKRVKLYNPKVSVLNIVDGVEVKQTFETKYGSFKISYILRVGAFLKYEVVFKNKTRKTEVFEVILRFLVKEKIRRTKQREPWFSLKEKMKLYLWDLGEIDETTHQWIPTKLKNVVSDNHKVDVIIGDYVLAENESFLIDPTTSTWQVGASTDDGWSGSKYPGYLTDDIEQFIGEYNGADTANAWYRFTGISGLSGASIDSAYIILYGMSGIGTPKTKISADDQSNPTYPTSRVDHEGRTRTSNGVEWDGNLVIDAWNTSPDIKTVIQELVDSYGDIGVIQILHDTNGAAGGPFYMCPKSWDNAAEDAPKLEITWTVALAYTLTLNVDKTSGYIGDAFTFTGTLTEDSTPISGATVTLYRDSVAVGSDITDSYGNYSIPWTADIVGAHNFYTETVV